MYLWFAYALAVLGVALLGRYVAARWATAPDRVPAGLRLDGRPKRLASKRVLWLPPAGLAVVVAFIGGLLRASPPDGTDRAIVALVFVTIAETAWFAAWMTDRQIELARGQTVRIAPVRTLRAFAPIGATIVVMILIAAANG